MIQLSDHDQFSLAARLRDLGHNPNNAARLLRAHYLSGGAIDFDAFTVSRSLRDLLENTPRRSRVVSRSVANDGTIKLLLEMTSDGALTETVLMPWLRSDRAAGCVSSQVGCAMGCDFCASTRGGLTRSLDAGEIIEQFLWLTFEARQQHRRLSSLVFMGMGEPMHNLDAVMLAIRRMTDRTTGSLGKRHITVSTVGIVPGIERLADAELGVHLALSLHAPDDATRQRLVPTGRKYLVADILRAARAYQDRSKRIGTIEYCLLAGENDSDEQARQLAALVAGWRVHVNVIPYNSIGVGLSGAIYRRPSHDRIDAFVQTLRANGVNADPRRTRGDDVNAACGQLRERFVQIGT